MSSTMGYASAQVPRQPLHDNRVLLPLGFTPTNRDIICGRARENFHHDGNRYFRDLINKNIGPYLSALTKIEKSDAIASIVDQVQTTSPSGGFVKNDSRTGRWLRIKESEARDKVGHALRKAIQRLEDTRPKAIARLKSQYVTSPLAAQPAQQPADASTSQEEVAASSKTSDHINEGEASESDRSSVEQLQLRAPGGVPPIARHGDSEQRGNRSRPPAGPSAVLAGLGNAALQQILLRPHLDVLNRSSQLALPGGGGDPRSGTHLMSRNFPPLSTSQLVAQRLLAQQNHHALPGVSSPYEQGLFCNSLSHGPLGQHSSLVVGRSMAGLESAKLARQDSLIIKVLQQQREQESRRMKELEYARRLVLEGGLVLPGLAGGGTQQTGRQRRHQQGSSTATIPQRTTILPSLNATLQHQSESLEKQETSQTHREHALLLGLLASTQNKGGDSSRNQETPAAQRRRRGY